jgi:proline iminopeptidase
MLRRLLRWVARILSGAAALVLLAFVALYLGTRGDYLVARTVAQDPSLPRVSLDGRVFHAESHGDQANPVVLVLHGGPGNDYRYLLPLTALADRYCVAFYDQRGTGLSPRVDPRELSLETMLADLDGMVDHFGAGRPVNLVGHSWGAMLASAYLGRHPEKVRAAVLAEPGLLTSDKAREFERMMRREFSLRLLPHAALSWFRSLHLRGPDDQAREDFFFQNLFTSAPPELSPLRGYFCDPADARTIPFWRYSWRSSVDIPNRARNASGEMELDLVAGVERFTTPVLFLCGECDRLIGADYQKDHMRHFPDARLVVISRAGHMMFNENPADSIDAVRRYLDALNAPAPRRRPLAPITSS